MRFRFGVPAALLVGMLAVQPVPATAQTGGDIADKRSDLDDLKRRISELQKEMAATEASRSDAAKAVSEAEREVSRVHRRLRKLEADRKDAEQQLARVEAEQREVESRIAARRDELADWLRRHYVHGAADGVAPLLSARDPNQLARDAHYLEYLGRARLALIDDLRADLSEKAARAADIALRRDRVAGLEAEQRKQRTALEAVEATRKKALTAIAAQLSTQKREVSALREDEQRLARLIDTLVQRAREAAAREAARRAAEQRAAERRAAAERLAAQRAAQDRGDAGSTTTPPAPRRAEPVVAEVRKSAGPTPTGVAFGQLRGQLRFPVRGELVGRFGAQRAEGGTTWKGVFIRATSGSDVRAVASGEVVYSDWLRGYGNLLIIDHGSDYLSVYGNNDALLKVVGDAVGGGEAIASVGASGGGADSGLYFEIRHQGRPLDPMQWVRLN